MAMTAQGSGRPAEMIGRGDRANEEEICQTRPRRSLLFMPDRTRGHRKRHAPDRRRLILGLEDFGSRRSKGHARERIAKAVGAGSGSASGGLDQAQPLATHWWVEGISPWSTASRTASWFPKVSSVADLHASAKFASERHQRPHLDSGWGDDRRPTRGCWTRKLALRRGISRNEACRIPCWANDI